MAEKRIRMLEQIEILKEYNPEITVKRLIAQLEGIYKYDDDDGTFDVVLVDGKNTHVKKDDASCTKDDGGKE